MARNHIQEEYINKAAKGRMLNKHEIVELLLIEDEDRLQALFEAARKIKQKIFSNKVFLYGFLYFSTWCRNDCNFVILENPMSSIAIENSGRSIGYSKRLADSGVHLIDLTMGEDMKYHAENFESLLDIVERIKKSIGLPVMISTGVLKNEIIDAFAKLGTEWYALYQETHNRELFKSLEYFRIMMNA